MGETLGDGNGELLPLELHLPHAPAFDLSGACQLRVKVRLTSFQAPVGHSLSEGESKNL